MPDRDDSRTGTSAAPIPLRSPRPTTRMCSACQRQGRGDSRAIHKRTSAHETAFDEGAGCLSTLALIVGLALASVMPAAAQTAAPEEAQHPRHLGRRHRLLERQRLQPGHDGLQDARTSTASRRKARCSPTGMASRAAPPAARASSPASAGFRTGMLKVGLPGAKEGLQARDVTIAELLKAQGYVTGAVRQEPPRRPRRAPAHRARLRRVLRLALPPQRRGGAGEPRLLQGSGAAARNTGRAA